MKKNIILGSAQFGLNYGISNKNGKVELIEIEKILETAKLSGIDTIDTAMVYGDSEKKLGSIGVNKWKIISKIPSNDITDKFEFDNFLEKNVEKTLKNLKLDSIHCLLVHDTSKLIEINQIFAIESIQRLKDRKLIKHFGFSISSEDELDFILKAHQPDIIQLPTNIFDRRFLKDKYIHKIKKKKIDIHSRSIFLQGLLLLKNKKIPKYFDQWIKHFNELENFTYNNKISKLQACIYFINKCKEVNNVVIGVEKNFQLIEILKELNTDKDYDFPQFDIIDDKILNPSNWN